MGRTSAQSATSWQYDGVLQVCGQVHTCMLNAMKFPMWVPIMLTDLDDLANVAAHHPDLIEGRELGPAWPGIDPNFGKSVPSRDQVDQDLDPTWPELGPTWPCRARVGVGSVGILAGLGHESGADLAKGYPLFDHFLIIF